MTVRIVTDSTADLPAELIQELGITVVPLRVNFGATSYLDGVELSADQFYEELRHSASLPTTSQPSPADFTEAYRRLATEADGIVSIHISQKLSGTCNSALLGRDGHTTSCPVEIIDSAMASMGLGLIVIQAARAAQAGADLKEVVGVTHQAIGKTHFFGMVDTLEYLHKGGRIGRARALLGTLLSIKPILQCRDGEVHPWGKERTRKKGINKLLEIVKGYGSIRDLSVLHSTTPEDAESLTDRLAETVDRERIIPARVGPVIGTYLGPGVIGVVVMEDDI